MTLTARIFVAFFFFHLHFVPTKGPAAIAQPADTLKNANATLNSVNQSYGDDSDFQRSLEQLMNQANDALRSIKLLSDYLDRHPEALLLGRSGK